MQQNKMHRTSCSTVFSSLLLVFNSFTSWSCFSSSASFFLLVFLLLLMIQALSYSSLSLPFFPSHLLQWFSLMEFSSSFFTRTRDFFWDFCKNRVWKKTKEWKWSVKRDITGVKRETNKFQRRRKRRQSLIHQRLEARDELFIFRRNTKEILNYMCLRGKSIFKEQITKRLTV